MDDTFTWEQLKQFVNKLDKKELEKPVTFWSEDRVIQITIAMRLTEDYYTNDGMDGCLPESEFKIEYPFDDPHIDKPRIAYEYGTPVLLDDTATLWTT